MTKRYEDFKIRHRYITALPVFLSVTDHDFEPHFEPHSRMHIRMRSSYNTSVWIEWPGIDDVMRISPSSPRRT